MTAAVILAAGEAKRADGPKIIWPVEGVPSIRRVAVAALNSTAISDVVTVTGRWEAVTREALRGLDVRFIHNPNFAHGQSSSLAAGLSILEPCESEVIFLLADQPFITSQIITDLIEFHKGNPGSITFPFCQGQRRNPVVFNLERWRQRLKSLAGDQGGRGLISENPAEVNVWAADAHPLAAFLDFDTSRDYEKLTNERS
ncbi:hypothetical protein C4J81_10495 [Deltaproteobacteria bacterium Smac51]|nr:hypothetical protein C4J81_10495 [Deltaproteobacteria bacterium Smac51]